MACVSSLNQTSPQDADADGGLHGALTLFAGIEIISLTLQAMDTDLDTDNDMDKIFNIITSIRGKNKRPDRDFICREAESLHGPK